MGKTIRLAAPLQYESMVDGTGLRMVLWCQGCRMHCPGCHNPETHDENGGKEYYIEDIKMALDTHYKYHDGLTLSGGDPFLQPLECKEIAAYAKRELGLNVWAYCGQTFEEIIKDPDKFELLRWCDVLIDGPFIKKEKDCTLAFRGSKNQRIIDVRQSLKQGEVVLWTI